MAELDIICAHCGKLLAAADEATETHIPSAEQLYRQGAVPVPNFGWFCSQACVTAYEKLSTVRFARNKDGLVDYYAKPA